MKIYHVYLPTGPHQCRTVAMIKDWPERNVVIVKQKDKVDRKFDSLFAAVAELDERYPGIYVDEM